MASISTPQQLEFLDPLLRPIGTPAKPTRLTHEHYIQICAECKDNAAKANLPPRQLAAIIRYFTRKHRY